MTDKKQSFSYDYPDELVALKPQEPCRVLYMGQDKAEPKELSLKDLQGAFGAGDVLVVNNSGVKACRVFHDELEVLFLKNTSHNQWEVLFKSSKMKVGETFKLPSGVSAKLIQKGRPQVIELDQEISEDYFNEFGEMALPPYIQKLRDSRRNLSEDRDWYQLDWKKNQKSLAAPTASLHFSKKDLELLKSKGVQVVEVSLNVGLGTFLPLEEKNFIENKLHEESFFVSSATKKKIVEAKKNKKRIWALGTTALRAVESMSEDLNDEDSSTDLFIYPGYEFRFVNGLLTNFHQPKSSLLCLVMAFYGVKETQKAYSLAVQNKFRLFSYGDLSVWKR